MAQLKELLVEELQDLLHAAEGQLLAAPLDMVLGLHQMRFEGLFQLGIVCRLRHFRQRLKKAFELLGEKAQPKPCKAMMGLVEEGAETIEESGQDPLIADLVLVASAQRVEHYEIAGYGNVRISESMLWPALHVPIGPGT